jgi:H+/Cl- antiporter ClcA
MAATFGSPVSAVLLAVELLLFEFRPRSIVPVALGSAAATGMRVIFEGAEPVFAMPALQAPHLGAAEVEHTARTDKMLGQGSIFDLGEPMPTPPPAAGGGTPRLRYANREQAEIAIGSGGLMGVGFLKGSQTNLDFVPEQHTDFVFTVIGEEFGFMGSVVLLGLYGVLLWRAFRVALLSRDPFGTYLAAGIASMFALQMFVNVGMNVGIMPITGIPLPFVSYGGSSLLLNLASVGLLLNVHMRRFV